MAAEKLDCVIEHFVFQSEDTGWAVARAEAKGFKKPVTIVGVLFSLQTGASIKAEGEWVVDKKYGQQFKVEDWEEVIPATIHGIKSYLGGSMISGIGQKTAESIVNYFGKKTIDVLDNEPERLTEVPGIGKAKAELIMKGWEDNREIKNVMIFLQGLDISTTYAGKIYEILGKKCIHLINDNPYILTEKIKGIGFKKSDAVAANKGIKGDDPRRIKAGILFVLNEVFAKDGSTYAEEEELCTTTVQLLNEASASLKMEGEDIEQDDFISALNDMKSHYQVNYIKDHIYLPYYYKAETESAKMLKTLMESDPPESAGKVDFEKLEKELKMSYAPEQKEAIQKASDGKLVVLTGGPGTGKTTTTNGIINWFDSKGLNILLAAPTGRAAKRMTEATGMEAKTIHRLLEYGKTDKGIGFKKNRKNPLEGDVLIVDEFSMVDIVLFYALLQAVPTSMRLVLVGDVNQLPSVGPGNVLSDIIQSEKATVVRLKTIFRQAMQSKIVTNAHRICNGTMPALVMEKEDDFYFTEREDPWGICQTIVRFVSKTIPEKYPFGFDDIQVLCPMIKGIIGTDNMNRELQNVLNPTGKGISFRGQEFRINDRVMQIKNNYDKDVFNGDIGKVIEVDEYNNCLTVQFDDSVVAYEKKELAQLVLSYASTIHKSQGSEFPVVIIPMSQAHYVMLQRNLIYTGVTRAKKLCILVGEKKALYIAVKNNKVKKRNSGLLALLNPNATRATSNIDWSQYYHDKPKETSPMTTFYPSAGDMLGKISFSIYRQGFSLSEEEKKELASMDESDIRKILTKEVENLKTEESVPEGWVQTVMHACAICCRGCVEKWYGFSEKDPLSDQDISFLVDVAMEYIQTTGG